MKPLKTILIGLSLALAITPAFGKSTKNLRVPKKFDYATERSLPVNIQVNTPDGSVAGLSFLAKERRNLTLLTSAVTQPGGGFQGTLQVPAATRQIIVRTRWAGYFKDVRVKAKRSIERTIEMP